MPSIFQIYVRYILANIYIKYILNIQLLEKIYFIHLDISYMDIFFIFFHVSGLAIFILNPRNVEKKLYCFEFILLAVVYSSPLMVPDAGFPNSNLIPIPI